MAFLTENGATNLRDIFMPESMCARCGEREPTFEAEFVFGELEVDFLGFCSDECLVKFLQGIKAAKLMAT